MVPQPVGGGVILSAQREHYTISDLGRVHACPVRYYYERDDPIQESDRYAICKQVSYHLGKPLDSDLIWNEVLAVRPGIDISLRELLEMSLAACNKSSWKPAVQYDARVISDRLGIAGMIDRIDADGAFSIVRPSGAMPFGVPSADRLRIAAISFCLEEMTGKVVTGGYLEYIPDGVSRFHEVQPRDRRQVIATLHKIRSIHEGEMPKHPLNAPCNRCKYREKCESSGGHRLSELL
ncbi:MAG: Dna2/Cas4 domain-containing protein [Methanoregula sp.]|nr:Dna2/Cas4 domain-containing protein [Methanoregula sp.]